MGHVDVAWMSMTVWVELITSPRVAHGYDAVAMAP